MSRARANEVHLTEEQLLLCADGESLFRGHGAEGFHLGDCSTCRGRLENLEEGVRAFLQFRDDVLFPAVPPPPNEWAALDARCDEIDHPWKHGFDSLRVEFASRRWSLAAAAALIILGFLALQPWEATVSAARLLAQAAASQMAAVRGTPSPVVHQRLRIRREMVASGPAGTADLELWRDLATNRFREKSSSSAIVEQLQRVYEANNLDWQSPLSAAAYETWRQALPTGHDSVHRGASGSYSGSGDLILTTQARETPVGDEIGRAQLIVRASDWHPVAARLWLKDCVFEISELSYQVQPLSKTAPSIFGELLDRLNPSSSAVQNARSLTSAVLTSQKARLDRRRACSGALTVTNCSERDQKGETSGQSQPTAPANPSNPPSAARTTGANLTPETAPTDSRETGAAGTAQVLHYESGSGSHSFGLLSPRLNLTPPQQPLDWNRSLAFADQLAHETVTAKSPVKPAPKRVQNTSPVKPKPKKQPAK
jgi:hypothetical protein